MDVELTVQAGMLLTGGRRGAPAEALPALVEAGWLSRADAAALGRAHALMSALQQVERVALDRPFEPERAGPGLKRLMARAGGEADFETLEAALRAAQAEAAAAVARRLAAAG
jgi:glutamate-ammonia-ligase adenylyltransferase